MRRSENPRLPSRSTPLSCRRTRTRALLIPTPRAELHCRKAMALLRAPRRPPFRQPPPKHPPPITLHPHVRPLVLQRPRCWTDPLRHRHSLDPLLQSAAHSPHASHNKPSSQALLVSRTSSTQWLSPTAAGSSYPSKTCRSLSLSMVCLPRWQGIAGCLWKERVCGAKIGGAVWMLLCESNRWMVLRCVRSLLLLMFGAY